MQPPTYDDVLAARGRVYAHMQPSPLLNHPLLDEWLGVKTLVKHENHNPTGAFKIRGGINLVSRLPDADRRRGIICASTGNHGQSLALASKLAGIRCRVVVPVGNNPEKNSAMRALGAEVLEHGRDFDDAREYVEAWSARDNVRYVHTANEPDLIAGVGTYAVEIFDAAPAVDIVFVPIGGGSGACGCCLVRSGRGAQTRIVGVQAARADAFTRSWRTGARLTAARADTFAEGIATRTTFDLTFSMLADELDDVVTVDEHELRAAAAAALRCTHNLVEGAGAASLAAARKYAQANPVGTVACVVSGGNADARTISSFLPLV
jgi:threonine dehydratase